MNPSRGVTRLAPAKVNLYLAVLGGRPDGFHDIESLLVALPWGDRVEATIDESDVDRIALDVGGEERGGVPTGPENLAWRAADALLRARNRSEGTPLSVHLTLTKHIPPGAGLGGGSSDAAATLANLGGALGIAEGTLMTIAERLGSDVPFLVRGGAAIARGRGERLTPLEAAPLPGVLLILPPFGCATKAVYARCAERLRPTPSGGLERAVAAFASGSPAAWREAHHNDLALAAMRVEPRLRHFLREVETRLGRPPMLSGSGSALFDTPDRGDEDAARDALADLPGRRVWIPA